MTQVSTLTIALAALAALVLVPLWLLTRALNRVADSIGVLADGITRLDAKVSAMPVLVVVEAGPAAVEVPARPALNGTPEV